MLKKYLHKLLCILLVFFIISCEKKENNILVVGTSANFPPFEYFENNKISGLDIDLMKAIGNKLNMKVVFEDMEFNTLLVALSKGKINVIAAGLTVTEERKKQIDFTHGYFSSKQVMIVKNSEKNIVNIESLKGKKVGVQLGTTGDMFVSALENVKNIKFDTGAIAIMDLKNGKISAVILDEEPAKKLLANNTELKIHKLPVVNEEYSLAINKNNTVLLEKINKIIDDMKKNGELEKIISKYFPNK